MATKQKSDFTLTHEVFRDRACKSGLNNIFGSAADKALWNQTDKAVMNLKLARQTRVLVIDDQVLAKGYLKYSLEELGFQNIEYADRASNALSAIRRHH